MLIGQYSVKLTAKNRAAVPKAFREALGKKIIIAKWYENCLVIVSQKNWQELMTRLTGRSEIITKPVRDTDRFILGSAFEAELDSQGRFVIPGSLKEFAGLEKEAVFIGLSERVEVWDKKAWQDAEQSIQEKSANLVEKLAAN